MKIGVNTRFLMKGHLEGFGHYTHEILSRMVANHPEHGYCFYFDRDFSHDFLYSAQVSGVALRPPARHPILFYVWNQRALRRRLKQDKVDIFFSPDSFIPLGLDCPSVITVHDVAHKPYPEGVSFAHRKYYLHFMPRFIEAATAIITVSEFSKREILKYYGVPEEKIHVVYNGIGKEYKPISPEMQQQVRTELSEGRPYFLFVGAIHPRKNVARLVKAYTLFRKKSKGDICLVIAGRMSWNFSDVEQAIAQSPYRNDIKITGYLDANKLAQVTASAFAMCSVSLYEGFGLPVVEAMACGVPVIVTHESAQSEVAGEAGLVVDAMNEENIAVAMTRLHSSEGMRREMIEAGFARCKVFSWDEAARRTYEILHATMNSETQ